MMNHGTNKRLRLLPGRAGRALGRMALAAVWLTALSLPLAGPAAAAQLQVVATFSILADMVRQIGGERVAVRSLVAAGGDAHVYRPSPAEARNVASAGLLVVNGLGFEGWIQRLITVSGYQGPVVTVSDGVTPRQGANDADHSHGHAHGHDTRVDPHAWQDLGNARIYAGNIAAALTRVDPAGSAAYAEGLQRYLAAIAATEVEIRALAARLPENRRRVVTPHEAFGYFGAAYGLTFQAPQGMTSEAEASATRTAALIREIRQEGLPAIFTEATTDPRLLLQIARETGARIGGTLYADTLSAPDGPAPTYLEMMRHNMRTIADAMMAEGKP